MKRPDDRMHAVAENQQRTLDWRPLRYFVAVAEELHFGRAAERLDIAQQSLSAQIQKLERAIGCRLLERAANRVRLTSAGDVFLQRARRILAEIDTAVVLTRRAAQGDAVVLRFGHCSAALRFVLPATVRALKARAPDLRFTTREMRGSEQLRALERGEIDLAFTYLPVDRSIFSVLVLNEEQLLVGLPSGHRFSQRDSIAPDSLNDEPSIALAKGLSAWADHVATVLEPYVGRQPAYEMLDKHGALGLVAEGLGFMVLPEGAALPFPNVTFVPLRSAECVPFAAVWLSEQNGAPQVEKILEAVRSATKATI